MRVSMVEPDIVLDKKEDCLLSSSYPYTKIGAGIDGDLVYHISPLPHATLSLHDGNELISQLVREHGSPTTRASSLAHSIQNPLHRCPAPLTHAERDRELQSCPTTSSSFLGPDAHQGGDGINSKRQIEYGIEGQMRGRRGARE